MYSELVSCQHVYLIVLDLYNLPMHFAIKVTPWYLRWSTYCRGGTRLLNGRAEERQPARASSTGQAEERRWRAPPQRGRAVERRPVRPSSTGPSGRVATGARLYDGGGWRSGVQRVRLTDGPGGRGAAASACTRRRSGGWRRGAWLPHCVMAARGAQGSWPEDLSGNSRRSSRRGSGVLHIQTGIELGCFPRF